MNDTIKPMIEVSIEIGLISSRWGTIPSPYYQYKQITKFNFFITRLIKSNIWNIRYGPFF
ncbi:hypothetical protein BH24BAC1_BH24BAC1_35720 [soil metagenome]